MQQNQLKTSEPDTGSDVSQTGIEQDGTSVVQDLVKNQQLMDSRVEFIDDLNLAMEQVAENVEARRVLGRFEQFTVNGLNGAIDAIKAKYKVGGLQARKLLAETEAVKKNRKLALFLKQDIDRAEAFNRIKVSFEKIIFHHLSSIVTKFVVGFANQLEKVANIDETLKNRKLKKEADKLIKEAEKREKDKIDDEIRRKDKIWSKWEDAVKLVINRISLSRFDVDISLLGRNSIMSKIADLPNYYYKQFLSEERQYSSIERRKGPLEEYEATLKSGAVIKLSVGNFEERVHSTASSSYQKFVESQLEISLPPDCVVVYYDRNKGKTGFSTFNTDHKPFVLKYKFDENRKVLDFFIIKLEESNGTLSTKIIDSFGFRLPLPRSDYITYD